MSFPTEWQDWANPIFAAALRGQCRRAADSGCAGLGLEWDETAVAAQLVD